MGRRVPGAGVAAARGLCSQVFRNVQRQDLGVEVGGGDDESEMVFSEFQVQSRAALGLGCPWAPRLPAHAAAHRPAGDSAWVDARASTRCTHLHTPRRLSCVRAVSDLACCCNSPARRGLRQESLLAMTFYKICDPYTPLSKRLADFIEHMFLPCLAVRPSPPPPPLAHGCLRDRRGASPA